MRRTFFARNALPLLCIVFFLIPFGLRGARLSLQRMKNDVKDWLPDDFQETGELKWFAQHFAGERFVVATWPGCTESDPRYHEVLGRIREEIEPSELSGMGPTGADATGEHAEDEAARRLGAEHDLFFTGDWHEGWGGRGERWLKGKNDTWYFITPDGRLYRWTTGINMLGRLIESISIMRGKTVGGTEVTEWSPHDAERYYQDPRRLQARVFGSVLTGPMVLERLSAEGGALWPRGLEVADADKPRVARHKALQRLTGSLFGSSLPDAFPWTSQAVESYLQEHPLQQGIETEDSPPARATAGEALAALAQRHYDGDLSRLATAPLREQQRNWLQLFGELGLEAPDPPTCFVITLSESGKRKLDHVIGRQMLGKPRGQLLAIADECGVPAIGADRVLRIGGPPVDNVAIDEEGSVTLVRLVGFSVLIGVGLSYLSFRSWLVTIMVFIVGGVSAIFSLSFVYWSGASVDAILLSMPSLVYVLGISGAVHIVNYYRDSCIDHGVEGAPEGAVGHGFGPCTLAAFTTALGLLSLYTSNILPIKKFGLYSAIAVMATLVLLFTYLPSALQLWPPGYHRESRRERSGFAAWMARFWDHYSDFLIRRHLWVLASCILFAVVIGAGMSKIKTSVQLLKLFDGNAQIIRDYQWLEDHVGELVPMEVVLRVPTDKILPPAGASTDTAASEPEAEGADLRLNLLERVELVYSVQQAIEREFGEQGRQAVGRGLSAASFSYERAPQAASSSLLDRAATYRRVNNRRLEREYPELLTTDYLRLDTTTDHVGDELWRISLRLGALTDIDYGQFIHELEDAVEPALAAYRYRDQLLRDIDRMRRARGEAGGFDRARILLLGAPEPGDIADRPVDEDSRPTGPIDQTRIFCEILQGLLVNAGCDGDFAPQWIDPTQQRLGELFESPEQLAEALQNDVDCVVLIKAHEDYDPAFLRQHAIQFVDATDHIYRRRPPADQLSWWNPRLDFRPTPRAAERADGGVHAIYTGVVPIVYKAQRTLLNSLRTSIFQAFLMIAAVMMVLLRNGPWRLDTAISFRGGLLSMLPNVFPAVVVFGAMGHTGMLVDIGSMMTASVAMGVAVDDTIHFLTWFRDGIRAGLTRNQAIKQAFDRCATAMTQTTLIGGLGLSVFALSTFTPTQRFGVLMLSMLAVALVGDLVMLPALLASPWGRYFAPGERKADDPARTPPAVEPPLAPDPAPPRASEQGAAAESHASSGAVATDDPASASKDGAGSDLPGGRRRDGADSTVPDPAIRSQARRRRSV